MGMRDHLATWEFQVGARPEQCVAAFRGALSEKTGFSLLGSQWTIRASRNVTVAIYEGRSGAMQGLTALSRLASQEQDAARGSELHFTVVEFDAGRGISNCRMWLASYDKVGPGGLPIFMADARFIRAAMERVDKALRELDPHAHRSLA